MPFINFYFLMRDSFPSGDKRAVCTWLEETGIKPLWSLLEDTISYPSNSERGCLLMPASARGALEPFTDFTTSLDSRKYAFN